MKVNWELMDGIFRELNPQYFKKSIYWDFKEYELKVLNQDKDVFSKYEFWKVEEVVDFHSSLLGDLNQIKEWINEKELDYEGTDIRVESFTQYTRYPDTEEVFCLISKTTEMPVQQAQRIKLYLEKVEKIEAEEKLKTEKQAAREQKELLRLKNKYEKESKNE